MSRSHCSHVCKQALTQAACHNAMQAASIALHLGSFIPSPHFQGDCIPNLEAVERNCQVSSFSHLTVIDTRDHISCTTIARSLSGGTAHTCVAYSTVFTATCGSAVHPTTIILQCQHLQLALCCAVLTAAVEAQSKMKLYRLLHVLSIHAGAHVQPCCHIPSVTWGTNCMANMSA